MRWQKAVTVIATVLIVVILAVALMPVYANHARLGLDLQGGVMVRLEAPEGTSEEEMNSAITIINNRINSLGVTEPEVRREGTNRISVELPGVDNPEEAVEMIGTTAKMEFIRVDTGETVISGSDLSKSYGDVNENTYNVNERYGVSLEFTSEGTKKFAAATQDLMSKYPGEANRQNRVIAIVLDGEVLSAPAVNDVINDGKARIQQFGYAFTIRCVAGRSAAFRKTDSWSAVGPRLHCQECECSNHWRDCLGVIHDCALSRPRRNCADFFDAVCGAFSWRVDFDQINHNIACYSGVFAVNRHGGRCQYYYLRTN